MIKKIMCFSLFFAVMMMSSFGQDSVCCPVASNLDQDYITVTFQLSGPTTFIRAGIALTPYPGQNPDVLETIEGVGGPYQPGTNQMSVRVPYKGLQLYYHAYVTNSLGGTGRIYSEEVAITIPQDYVCCKEFSNLDQPDITLNFQILKNPEQFGLGWFFWSTVPGVGLVTNNIEGASIIFPPFQADSNQKLISTDGIPRGIPIYYTVVYLGDYGYLFTWEASFTLPIMNQAPVADAGDGQTVHPGTSVTLDGSLSTDPDGNYPLTYAWTILQKPSGSAAALATPNLVSTSINIDLPGEYRVQLVVTDSLGLAGNPAEVTLSMFNTAPVAAAGNDQEVIKLDVPVSLDGSQSWDEDGDPLTYLWTLVQKPLDSNAAISDPTSATPTITPDIYGDYTIQLVASDPWESSAPDEVVVSTKNLAPIADAGNNQSCLQGDTVSFNGGASSDPNGDTLTYSWQIVSKPAGSSAYLTGAGSVTASLHTDLAGEYVVALIVNDGLLDSPAATAAAVATSYVDAVIQKLNQVITTLNGMPNSAFRNAAHKDNLTRKVSSILVLVQNGEYHDAYVQLGNSVLQKLDGCALNGTPENNDWIKSCTYQDQVYPLVNEALALLDNLY